MFLKGCSCERDRDSKLAVTWEGGGVVVAKSCLTLAAPWTVVYQAPLPRGVSRQEYWSGLPFPPPGIFPAQELNLGHLNCMQILYLLSYEGSPSSDLNKIKVDFSIRYNSSWYNNSALCGSRGPSSFCLATLLFLKFCSYLRISKSTCNQKALISSFYSRKKKTPKLYTIVSLTSQWLELSHTVTLIAKEDGKYSLGFFFFFQAYMCPTTITLLEKKNRY